MNETNYGFMFNDISIYGNQFNKKFKNESGKDKINDEIKFYLYIIENNIEFPMPKLIHSKDGNITIEYISNAIPLTTKINMSNIYEYVDKIKSYFFVIHGIKKNITNEIIQRDLDIELNTKIINRFSVYDWDNNLLFKSIKTVNHIEIKNIYYYRKIIQEKIMNYLKTRDHYHLIHGDPHLGNILIDKNDIYFIDPRGYFGESKLFGICEYDYAKLMFGISGYSTFDNMIIHDINIVNHNLEINFIKEYEYVFELEIFDDLTKLLCLSIWLGNNSCFSNINKKITSLMIAYYYCEKYFKI
jgi:tRNA A-37 threonylcarbamoyl transferase component Bud32